MANDRSKKIPEFTELTDLAEDDMFIVEDASANTATSNTTTKMVKMTTLRKQIVRGPYANNAAANTAGVLVGQMYYNANGVVFVRTS